MASSICSFVQSVRPVDVSTPAPDLRGTCKHSTSCKRPFAMDPWTRFRSTHHTLAGEIWQAGLSVSGVICSGPSPQPCRDRSNTGNYRGPCLYLRFQTTNSRNMQKCGAAGTFPAHWAAEDAMIRRGPQSCSQGSTGSTGPARLNPADRLFGRLRPQSCFVPIYLFHSQCEVR